MKILILTMNLDLVEELFFFLVIFIIGIWLLYDRLITLNGTKKQILSFVYYLYLPVIGIIFGQAQKEKYLTTFLEKIIRILSYFCRNRSITFSGPSHLQYLIEYSSGGRMMV